VIVIIIIFSFILPAMLVRVILLNLTAKTQLDHSSTKTKGYYKTPTGSHISLYLASQMQQPSACCYDDEK